MQNYQIIFMIKKLKKRDLHIQKAPEGALINN